MRLSRLALCVLCIACSGSAEQATRPAVTAARPDTLALADSLRRLVPLGLGIDSAQARLTRVGFHCRAVDFGAPQGLTCGQQLPGPGPAPGVSLVWGVTIDQGGWSGRHVRAVHSTVGEVLLP